MSVLIQAENCVDAWVGVVNHLLANGSDVSNILVSIDDPAYFEPAWLTRFDPRAVKPDGDWIRDVMNTVFPQKTLANSADRHEFFARYLKGHRRRKTRRWGTYFERLICFGAKQQNQLESIVTALTNWKNTPHAAMTVHLSSSETDSLRPLGAPCWHFGEFLCPDKQSMELTVVYRNHDYFNKALGNFIGLSRLLSFMCGETGRKPGKLVCHSVRAYYDATKHGMSSLIAR